MAGTGGKPVHDGGSGESLSEAVPGGPQPARRTGDAAALLSLIERVSGLLSSPPLSQQACLRMENAVQELYPLAKDGQPSSEQEEAALLRRAVALAEQLSKLNHELLRQLGRFPYLLQHVGCCTSALCSCLAIATRLQRPPSRSEAYKLASGLEVVLGAGAQALRCALMALADDSYGCIPGELAQTISMISADVQRQIITVATCVEFLSAREDGGQLATAWARTAGRPDVLLDWLAVAVQALTAVAEAGQDLNLECMADLCFLCCSLLQTRPFEAHAAVLAGHEQGKQALVRLLLRWGLPQLAAALADAQPQPEWQESDPCLRDSATQNKAGRRRGVPVGSSGAGSSGSCGGGTNNACSASGRSSIGGAARSCRGQPAGGSLPCCLLNSLTGVVHAIARDSNDSKVANRPMHRYVAASGGAAVLTSAVRVVAAIPVKLAGVEQAALLDYHLSAARLLLLIGSACAGLELGWDERVAYAQQAQQAQQAWRRQQPVRATPRNTDLGSRDEVAAAALSLGRLLPHMGAVLRLAGPAADADAGAASATAAGHAGTLRALAHAYFGALEFVARHLVVGSADSIDSVEAWAVNADAALQLVPLALACHPTWQAEAAQGVADAAGAAKLAEQLMCLCLGSAHASRDWAASPQAWREARPSLANVLWALHQRAGRFVNSLAATRSSWLGASWLMRRGMATFHRVHQAASTAAAACGDGFLPARRAMAGAHLEAVQAVMEAAAAVCARGGCGVARVGGYQDLFVSLDRAARDCPAVVDARFANILEMVLDSTPASADPAEPEQLSRAAARLAPRDHRLPRHAAAAGRHCSTAALWAGHFDCAEAGPNGRHGPPTGRRYGDTPG